MLAAANIPHQSSTTSFSTSFVVPSGCLTETLIFLVCWRSLNPESANTSSISLRARRESLTSSTVLVCTVPARHVSRASATETRLQQRQRRVLAGLGGVPQLGRRRRGVEGGRLLAERLRLGERPQRRIVGAPMIDHRRRVHRGHDVIADPLAERLRAPTGRADLLVHVRAGRAVLGVVVGHHGALEGQGARVGGIAEHPEHLRQRAQPGGRRSEVRACGGRRERLQQRRSGAVVLQRAGEPRKLGHRLTGEQPGEGTIARAEQLGHLRRAFRVRPLSWRLAGRCGVLACHCRPSRIRCQQSTSPAPRRDAHGGGSVARHVGGRCQGAGNRPQEQVGAWP